MALPLLQDRNPSNRVCEVEAPGLGVLPIKIQRLAVTVLSVLQAVAVKVQVSKMAHLVSKLKDVVG